MDSASEVSEDDEPSTGGRPSRAADDDARSVMGRRLSAPLGAAGHTKESLPDMAATASSRSHSKLGGPMSTLQLTLSRATKRLDRLEKTVEELLERDARMLTGWREEVGRLVKVDQEQRTGIEKLETHMGEVVGELKESLQDATVGVSQVASRLRTDWHRMEQAAAVATRSERKVTRLHSEMSETKGGIRGEFERFARSLQSLGSELEAVRASNSELREEMGELRITGIAGLGRRNSLHEAGAPPRGSLQELLQRVEESIDSQRRTVHAQEQIEKQVKACVRREELDRIDRRVQEMDARDAKFHKYVTDQIFSVKRDRAATVVASWSESRDKRNRKKLMHLMLCKWCEYICRRDRFREALGRTQHRHAKLHVTEWVRTWWYIMQRDTNARQFARLAEESGNHSLQLEMLLTTVHRHEKTTTEQVRQLTHRILSSEQLLDSLDQRKADKDVVAASFDAVQARLDQEFNIKEVRGSLEALRVSLAEMEAKKYNVEQAEKDRKTLAMLAREVRDSMRRHEERLDGCALLETMALKADAQLVEEVFLLLAQQADQLASLLASDLAKIRKAMSGFLELSPDIRKAALSMGLEPTEQCVSCRTVKRKQLLETMTGADGATYKMCPDVPHTASEQAQKVLTEKLGLPSSLASSIAAGAALQQATQQQQPPASAFSSLQQPPPRPQQLRKLLAASPGWAAGKAVPNRVEEEQSVPKGFFPAVSGREPVPMLRPSSRNGRGSDSEAGTVASGNTGGSSAGAGWARPASARSVKLVTTPRSE